MQAVIIAAGKSSRFWPLNQNHKSQTYLLGKPLIYWTIKGLAENGIKDIVVVCRAGSTLPEVLKNENDLALSLRFVLQEKSLGTGNALWQARDLIKDPFFVLWPNKVNAGEIAKRILEQKKTTSSQVVLVGAQTSTPWDYGVAKMYGGRVVEIVENPERGKEPSNMKIIGFYALGPDFFSCHEKIPRHHEADLIVALNLYLKDKKASLVELQEDVPTLKYPWELFGILDILFNSENFQQGIAKSAVIGSNVIIKGQVHIGEKTIIKDNTIIEGPCFIGDNCIIGHANVLRGPLNLENNVMTGAFCEIKHSIIQEGTHFHSGFVGDSLIGKNCRVSAGFVTANRRLDRENVKTIIKGKRIDTGTSYFGVVMGDETKVGINVGTMPGILIGSNCVVGPGTYIFENVPNGTRIFAKPQYVIKKTP